MLNKEKIRTQEIKLFLLYLNKKTEGYHMTQQFQYLSIYPGEENTYVHKKVCTQVFLAALLITANEGNNPKVHQLMNG